jgi:hypothetical protein
MAARRLTRTRELNVTFRQEIERQALAARRQMVRAGELLGADKFRERLHVTASQLARMVAKGDIFTVEVDGVEYFPSLMVAPEVDLRRLYSHQIWWKSEYRNPVVMNRRYCGLA